MNTERLSSLVELVKAKGLSSGKLKSLRAGIDIRLLSAGRFDGYTDEVIDGFIHNGEVLAIAVGGSFNVKYHKGSYYTANNYILKSNGKIDLQYLKYYLEDQADLISEFYRGWGCKKLHLNDLLNFEVTYPSTARQKEVVRILDTFTDHTAELTAELTARKKQYNYYRDKLLTFEEGEVEWRKLGEVCEVKTGSSNRQDESQNGIYPFYVRSKNILRSNTFEFDEKAIIVPGEGGIGDIFHYVNGKYALHQRAYRICVKSKTLNTKFLYYFMLSYFKRYILMKSVGATSVSIRKPMLENFPIPIPPLPIQKEIVRILDTFTDHTAELTAELTARKNNITTIETSF